MQGDEHMSSCCDPRTPSCGLIGVLKEHQNGSKCQCASSSVCSSMPPLLSSASHSSHSGPAGPAGPATPAQQLWDAASLGDVVRVDELSSAEDSELETLCGPVPPPPGGTRSRSTPLHAAACAGHTACALVLLSAGAIVDTENTAGATAFACAGTRGHTNTMVLLGQHGATVVKPQEDEEEQQPPLAGEPPLTSAVANRPKLHVPAAQVPSSSVQALCATGASVRAVDDGDDGATDPEPEPNRNNHSNHPFTDTPVDSIVAACENGNLRVLHVLTHFSGDVNQASAATGNTGLHVAAENGRVDLARELLCRGARVSTQNHQGLTPLHIAVMRDEGGDSNSHAQQLVELLLRYHGAVTLEDDPGGAVPSVHSTAVASHNPRIAGMLHARTSAAQARRTAAAAEVAHRVREAPEDPAVVREYFVQQVLDAAAAAAGGVVHNTVRPAV